MRNVLLTFMAGALLLGVILTPSACTAQYYPQYDPYVYPPGYYYARPAPQGPPSVQPYSYYYMTPDPMRVWRWEQYKRWLDYQALQKIPLDPINPESDFDYLIRTY